jgi:hypothetical protein
MTQENDFAHRKADLHGGVRHRTLAANLSLKFWRVDP